MATTTAPQEGLTHRSPAFQDNDGTTASRDPSTTTVGGASSRKPPLTAHKRGLRSLAAAVSLAALLTALSFFASGGSAHAKAVSAATVAMVRAGSVAAEAVLALAAWMAWAEGGLHARPGATLEPFAAQLAAALAWAPLVLGRGAGWAGLACCVAMGGATAACARGFGGVNPVAGDLAKPGVAWAVILAVVNYRML